MFEDVLNLIVDNKEWVFGGVGVFALGSIGGLIGWIFKHRKAKAEEDVIQQLVGDRSSQINASGTGDVTVNIGQEQTSKLDRPTIHQATMEDIKKYDPKTLSVVEKAKLEEYRNYVRRRDTIAMSSPSCYMRYLGIIAIVGILSLMLLFLYLAATWFGFL